MQRLAQFISFVFHPAWMPTIGIYIAFGLFLETNITWEILAVVFSLTAVWPMLALFGLMKKGLVKDWYVANPKERYGPILAGLLGLCAAATWLWSAALPPSLVFFFCASAAAALMALIFLPIVKISLHMLAVGAVVGCLVVLGKSSVEAVAPVLAASLLLVFLVNWSRLYLKAHTRLETRVGFSLGCGIQLAYFLF